MDILFLGDSITDCGHCFTADNLGDGFVKKLSLLPGINAVNGGSDGFTFPRVLQKWERLYAQNQYDCAVITGGVNETAVIAGTGLSEEQAALFLERSAEALRFLLEGLIRQRTKRILLVEPFLFPVPEYLSLWIPSLQRVRRRIKKTASVFDPNTVFYLSVQKELDLLAGQAGLSAVTTDGIHLTKAGHDCLAKLLEGSISRF
ncbi:MAG: SGNH/GDSL hydrolase family protein [Lachnospiraceae bacterium]|nr:SGNH/GDSL hydrolase family protein [Lachnospiraceae bacterium]